jgi:hypothetical protein
VVDPVTNPLNRRLVDYLKALHPEAPAISAPDEGPDPYWEAGCHPDVVERVWDQLGARFQPEARIRIFGVPSLIQPTTGTVLVVAMGMAYALRLTPADLEEAGRSPTRGGSGSWTVEHWSDGTSTDIAAVFGADWVFGDWDRRETDWCYNSFLAF